MSYPYIMAGFVFFTIEGSTEGKWSSELAPVRPSTLQLAGTVKKKPLS